MKDVQFVVSETGEKTAVQISLQQYEAFLDYLEDVQLGRAAREALSDDERIPWEQVKAEMTADGSLEA